jgi:uncharacterized protein YrrD
VSRISRAAEIIGLPVVTLDKATAIGEVRDVLFDPGRARVIGFTLRGRGLLSSPLLGILPAEWVQAMGRDAIMVKSETSVIRDREGMASALGEQQEVIGKEVVTETGASLGEVSDVVLEVERNTATVVGYEIDHSGGQRLIVPVDGGVPISGDALVVPADADQRAATGLAGFREARERDQRTEART